MELTLDEIIKQQQKEKITRREQQDLKQKYQDWGRPRASMKPIFTSPKVGFY